MVENLEHGNVKLSRVYSFKRTFILTGEFMKLLRGLTIKYKLVAMLLLPIIGLFYFSFFYITDKINTTQQINKIEKLVVISLNISDLVHQLQTESALSVASIQNHSDQSHGELQQQYGTTDKVIAELNEFFKAFSTATLKKELRQRLEDIPKLLTDIVKQRELLHTSDISALQTARNYHQINQSFIDLIQKTVSLNENHEIYVLSLSFINLLTAKELAGLERAILMNALIQKHFKLEQYKEFVELVAQQIVYRRSLFTTFATPAQIAMLDEMTKGQVFTESYKIREKVFAAGTSDELSQISPEQWFNVQTQKIELLRKLQDKTAQDLLSRTLSLQSVTQQQLFYSTALTILLLVFTILLVFLVIRGLTRQLQRAASVANAIAEGKLDNRISIDNHDETGNLLAALGRMQQQINQLINKEKQVAEAALRINRALDSVTTSVLITDEHSNIIYLNKAAQELFLQEQESFQAEFPNFNAKQLLGQNINIFFPGGHHYNSLDNINNSEHGSLNLRNIMIDYIITPVINHEGRRLGLVKEFRDRTLEMAMEREINTVIQAASQTDFSKRISLEEKTGFFKLFSEGVNQILKFNQLAVQDLMRVFSAVAKGDLTQVITNQYVGEFAQLKNDANTTVQRLTEIMSHIKQAAGAVSLAAEEIMQGNLSLNQRTEQQAAALEQTAASMEQMTSTVQQNADNAKHATQLAASARNYAEKGSDVVGNAVKAITEINNSSKKIAEITSVIDEIAFQTNLLALNAAVEAARAGEQGRGFAVVAAEVRNLAQRSATAAKEIKKLIQDSVVKVEEGTRLANKSGDTLQDIVVAVKKVSDIVAEISAASQEQASGIHQVNKAISQMDETTQQNAALVEQAAASSEFMREQAEELKRQVSFFKLGQETLVITRPPAAKAKRTIPPPVKMPVSAQPPVHEDHEWEDF